MADPVQYSYEPLREFGRSLSQEQKDMLNTAHSQAGPMCNAGNESLPCCVDYILGEEGEG